MNRAPHLEDNPAINEQLGHVHVTRFVDKGFLEDLKRIDALLEPRWNALKARWEIYRDGLYIMTVRSNDGGYAHLDNRVFQRLFVIDTGRYVNAFQFIRSLRLEDDRLMSMKRYEQDEFMRACYRDMAPILRGRKTINGDVHRIINQEKIIAKDLRRVGVK